METLFSFKGAIFSLLFQFLNAQKKLNSRHEKWVSFLTKTRRKQNQVADALSRRLSLLGAMSVEAVGFEAIKGQYKMDPYFSSILEQCELHIGGPGFDSFLQEGFISNLFYLSLEVGQGKTYKGGHPKFTHRKNESE